MGKGRMWKGETHREEEGRRRREEDRKEGRKKKKEREKGIAEVLGGRINKT